MEKKICQLRICFDELFPKGALNNTYIEISDGNEIVLSGNEEGLLHLVDQIIRICESDLIGGHYHLDECSIADKCDKPMIFSLMKAPW